ncbi:MAG: efflux RND transporter periplasmic adaptor subunit [Candidatus Aminicenantes bacterium]|nr:efflux RND transporter periplasmic adaptor subunit [Candidatus Aminicenantes bacterium]
MEIPRPKKKRKKAAVIALFGLLAIILVIGNLRSRREKSLEVTIERVSRKGLTSIVSASGEIKPKKNINISAQVPGQIIKIGVVEGQEVKTGDFLIKFDATQYEAVAERDKALIQASRSQLIQAEARMKREQNNYERQKQLFDSQLISQEQLETAKVDFDIAKAEVQSIRHQIQQAEASLKSTLDSLGKTIYHSPIDGIITSLPVEEGEIAVVGTLNFAGTILMTIADLSEMEVEVEVDETDVIGVRLGQKARVKVDALPDQILDGTVTEIGSSAIAKMASSQQESRDFLVAITLTDPPDTLKPGLSASADIITAEKKEVLAVPISALVLREKEGGTAAAKETEEEGVYIVTDGRAKFCPVNKGIMGGMSIEITSGLKEGQEVIVGPYVSLRELKDGTLVKTEKKSKKPE